MREPVTTTCSVAGSLRPPTTDGLAWATAPRGRMLPASPSLAAANTRFALPSEFLAVALESDAAMATPGRAIIATLHANKTLNFDVIPAPPARFRASFTEAFGG
jgi:hypothetical protein